MPLSPRTKMIVRVSVVLFLCLIFYLSRARKARHASAYKASVSFAKISFEELRFSTRNNPSIFFTFLVDGVKRSGSGSVPRISSKSKLLKALEQDVFVVYSPQDPKVYDLLMIKSDLSDYNIAYPDSVLSSVNSIADIIGEF